MTIDEALKKAGFKVKVRRTGKRWPRKKGSGRITIVVTTDRKFKPGTGFAINFVATEEE